MSQKLEHNGRSFTIWEWAERIGLKKKTLRARLRRGWTIEEALDPEAGERRKVAGRVKSGKHNERLLTWKGETLPTSAWARRTGLARRTIRERLRAGWTVERALSVPVTRQVGNRYKARPYTWNDKTQTLAEWADELGVNTRALQNRLQAGWSIERTLSSRGIA